MSKIDIRSLNLTELTAELTGRGLPKFRAAQVYSWLHEKGVADFSEMTNLSKDLRAALSQDFVLHNCKIDTKLVSQLDETVKYLFQLNEGEYIESVVMKYKYGYTICISTQLGCGRDSAGAEPFCQ